MRLLFLAAAMAALTPPAPGLAAPRPAAAALHPATRPEVQPPGRLLVVAAPYGLAIVTPAGEVTKLGKWYDAAWSADGTRIAAANGRRLAVLDASGRVLWTKRRSTPAEPDWSSDGTLLAYRDGHAVRVVRADGRGDHAVAHG